MPAKFFAHLWGVGIEIACKIAVHGISHRHPKARCDSVGARQVCHEKFRASNYALVNALHLFGEPGEEAVPLR